MRTSMTGMRASLGWSFAAVLAAAGTAPSAPAIAQAQVSAAPAGLVQVNTGRGRLVTLSRPMSDLFVADDTIADVQVRSPTQLYIFGKKTGETTISATAKGGAIVYSSTVRVGNNLDSIQQMLGLAMPEAQVVATPMNGLVLLTGTVAAPEDAAEAERLVQAFVGDATKVLSRLKTATPLQVNLQVRVAEVSRSFVKTIGVNLTSRGSGNFLFNIAQGRQGTITTVPGVVGVPGAAVDVNGAVPGNTLFGFLQVHHRLDDRDGRAPAGARPARGDRSWRTDRTGLHARQPEPHRAVGGNGNVPRGRRSADPDRAGAGHGVSRV
ncbi:pilus assembly protein N-terminal domain-containing protein [Sphingomonas aerolata]|uniref:pilus assembly protein N-terminal domain-containing protein n=1 Tax=Sphingomonas aerolata TaxID=185951 RepID=UPI002FE05ADC